MIEPHIKSYPIPWKILSEIAGSALFRKKRSFRQDAVACVRLLEPPLLVKGMELIPAQGPFLLVMNHYSRAGFGAWWIALAISAVVPLDIHWIMTDAWTFDQQVMRRPLVPLTRLALRRLASMYSFTLMPAMPPQVGEVAKRAAAVRQVLTFAHYHTQAVIGLAPEGQDFSDGVLGCPPKGVGRFINHLAKSCKKIVPVGVFESSNQLYLQFGKPFYLAVERAGDVDAMDQRIAWTVMSKIAHELPAPLRGVYAQ